MELKQDESFCISSLAQTGHSCKIILNEPHTFPIPHNQSKSSNRWEREHFRKTYYSSLKVFPWFNMIFKKCVKPSRSPVDQLNQRQNTAVTQRFAQAHTLKNPLFHTHLTEYSIMIKQ